MSAERMPHDRAFWPVDAVLNLFRDWIGRFFAVQAFDRAMAIAAYGYSALIPGLIVYSALLPTSENRSFADTMVDRLELTGSAAASVRLAFAPTGDVESGVTALGVLLLVISALSFARALQRLYEGCFGLPTLGMRNTIWDLVWLLVLAAFAVLRPLALGRLDGTVETIGSLTLTSLVWLMTPYLLLARRLPSLHLLPAALLSTIGMTGVGIWSVVWLPHTITASASQYGVIGIGFALLSWLFVSACVLVVAATGGALVTDRVTRRRRTTAA